MCVCECVRVCVRVCVCLCVGLCVMHKYMQVYALARAKGIHISGLCPTWSCHGLLRLEALHTRSSGTRGVVESKVPSKCAYDKRYWPATHPCRTHWGERAPSVVCCICHASGSQCACAVKQLAYTGCSRTGGRLLTGARKHRCSALTCHVLASASRRGYKSSKA